jgi:Ca-dependent carbohydrate-binding module xylan-binding
VEGDWGPGAHSVGVEFLNDAYAGPGADRNLHLDGLSYNGVPHAGGGSALYWGGLHGFAFADTAAGPAPVDTTLGAGPNALVLKLSQDAWQGSAQYTVSVDGRQIGGTLTAGALHGSGATDTLTLRGEWSDGPHSVALNFLNDAWGGSAAADRNLHVEEITFDGAPVPVGVSALLWGGEYAYAFM